MLKYCLKRIGMAAATILAIIIILFFLLQLMPGSPFNNERLTDEQKQQLEEKYGLDKSLPEQIVIYIKNMLTGDFGVSYNIQQNYPVASLLASRYPVSIRIGLQAFAVGVILGLVLGIISALHHNSILDTGTTVFAMLGSSIPSHVVALALLFFLAFRLDLFPLTYSSGTPVLSSIVLLTAGLSPIFQGFLDFLGKEITLTGRTFIWASALKKIHAAPIMGYGYGEPAFNHYVAHNQILELLVNGGTVLLMIFYAIYIYIGIQERRFSNAYPVNRSISVLKAALIGVGIDMMTEIEPMALIFFVFCILYYFISKVNEGELYAEYN